MLMARLLHGMKWWRSARRWYFHQSRQSSCHHSKQRYYRGVRVGSLSHPLLLHCAYCSVCQWSSLHWSIQLCYTLLFVLFCWSSLLKQLSQIIIPTPHQSWANNRKYKCSLLMRKDVFVICKLNLNVIYHFPSASVGESYGVDEAISSLLLSPRVDSWPRVMHKHLTVE
jgi:hypothetical protein